MNTFPGIPWQAGELVCALLFVLSTVSPTPLAAQGGQRIEIPGTSGSLTLPSGWSAGPGSEGAVLMLQASDGTAQILVNRIVPDTHQGQTAGQLREAIADATRQQVLNAGLPLTPQESQHVNLGGRLYRIDSFPINDPAQPMLLEFVYVVHGNLLLAFNISAAQQAPQRIAEARQTIQSLTDPPSPTFAAIAPPDTFGAFSGSPSATTSLSAPSPPSQVADTASADLRDLSAREVDLMRRLTQRGYRSEWETELATVRADLAAVRWQAGDNDAAIAYLSSAVELDPTRAERCELLADLLDDSPAPAAPFLAQSYYEDALDLNPANRPCRLKLASSYQATGELEDAISHFEILALNHDGSPDPAYLQNLCLLYLSAGEEARGDAFLERIVMGGAPAEFCLVWAILKDARGDSAEAARLAHYTASVTPVDSLRDYATQLARSFEQKGARP